MRTRPLSPAGLREPAQRADIHLREHHWLEFLLRFRLATNGGTDMAAYAPAVLAQRSFTRVCSLCTRPILAEGLVIKENKFLKETTGRWASVRIEWIGITITLVSVYAPAVGTQRSSFISPISARSYLGAPKLVVLGDVKCTLDQDMNNTNSHSARHKAGRAELSQFMLQRGLQVIWFAHHRAARQLTGPL
jgi:hypothetical protein